MFDTWKCHICGEERPNARISVNSRDVSADHNLPVGTMKQNVRYCNDKKECIEKAKERGEMSKKKFTSELKDCVGRHYSITCDSCSEELLSDSDEFDSKIKFLKDAYDRGWRYCSSEDCSICCATVCPGCMDDKEQDWKEDK